MRGFKPIKYNKRSAKRLIIFYNYIKGGEGRFFYLTYRNTLSLLLQYISAYSVIVPIILCVIWRKALSKEMLVIFVLLFVSLTIDVACIILGHLKINNMFLMTVFTVIEFISLIFFYKLFFDKISKSIIHYIIGACFLVYIILDEIVFNDVTLFDSVSVSIESVIIILYSLISFYFIIKNIMYEDLLAEPFFWINTALLIYFSGNLFLFSFSKYLQNHHAKDFLNFYVIHSVLHIIYYSLISLGFWKAKRKLT